MTITYTVTQVGERPRLGWVYSADPELDPRYAITLLRDLADELEMDLPDAIAESQIGRSAPPPRYANRAERALEIAGRLGPAT